jgi:hypothetical protein
MSRPDEPEAMDLLEREIAKQENEGCVLDHCRQLSCDADSCNCPPCACSRCLARSRRAQG